MNWLSGLAGPQRGQEADRKGWDVLSYVVEAGTDYEERWEEFCLSSVNEGTLNYRRCHCVYSKLGLFMLRVAGLFWCFLHKGLLSYAFLQGIMDL